MPKCPLCGKVAPKYHFIEREMSCEDCGSHEALECPNCGELIDLVYNNLEEDK